MKFKTGILVLALQSLFGAVLTKSFSDNRLHFEWMEDESWKDAIKNLVAKMDNAWFYGGQRFTDPLKEGNLISNDELPLNCINRGGSTPLDMDYVNPMGICFRLFKNPDCLGHSLALYHGSKDAPNIEDSEPHSFSSIGFCYEHEMESSTAARTPQDGIYTKEDYSTNYLEAPDRMPGQMDQCTRASLDLGDPATVLDRLPLAAKDCANRPAQSMWLLCNPETVPNCHYPSGWIPERNNELVGDDSLPPAEEQVLKAILPPNMNKGGISSPAMEGFIFQRKKSALEWERVIHKFVDNSMVAKRLMTALLMVTFAYADGKATQPSGFDYYIAELAGNDSGYEVGWATGGFIRN